MVGSLEEEVDLPLASLILEIEIMFPQLLGGQKID